MSRFIPVRTEDEQQRITANYLPDGKLTEAKNIPGKFLYKITNSFSKVFGRAEEKINTALNEVDITKSSKMVKDWESALKIPDAYYNAEDTDEERRRYALLKLSQEGVYSDSQLEWLCMVYGVKARAYPGHIFWTNYNPMVGTFASEKQSRFTQVFGVSISGSDTEVSSGVFPISFPYSFGANRYNTLQRFMREVIPANVDIRWFVDDIDVIQDTVDSADIWNDTEDSTEIIQDVVN